MCYNKVQNLDVSYLTKCVQCRKHCSKYLTCHFNFALLIKHTHTHFWHINDDINFSLLTQFPLNIFRHIQLHNLSISLIYLEKYTNGVRILQRNFPRAILLILAQILSYVNYKDHALDKPFFVISKTMYLSLSCCFPSLTTNVNYFAHIPYI